MVPLLNGVARAVRVAQLGLAESGFGEKVAVHKERKRKQRDKGTE